MPRAEREEFPTAGRRVTPRHAAPGRELPPVRPVAVRDDLRERRARAAEAWAATMGDATSCALAKDGRSHPAGKFHEGRTAALGELMRACPADATAPSATALAAALADEWAGRAVPGGGSRDWESYRAGGIEALREVAAS
ncbi:hypothetical protein GCM10009819_15870 [Agromyces tropicus]|uniref:Uncharacterized protein n=1 Tax=Agromyces tropicus TaxID=555371 RepID=A0ABP5FV38_9MICO